MYIYLFDCCLLICLYIYFHFVKMQTTLPVEKSSLLRPAFIAVQVLVNKDAFYCFYNVPVSDWPKCSNEQNNALLKGAQYLQLLKWPANTFLLVDSTGENILTEINK